MLRTTPRERTLIALAFAAVLAVQLHLVWTKAILWDEFFHYNQVFQLLEGTLQRPVQTLYARLFAWLPLVPGGDIAQLRIGRLVMVGFELASAFFLYGIARRFTAAPAAAIAALAWIGGGWVLLHGFSFRNDPIAVAVMMGALWILATRELSLRNLAVFGALCGLGPLVTIKTAFFLPPLAGLAWLRLCEVAPERRKGLVLRLALAVPVAAATAALVFSLHRIGLAPGQIAEGKTAVGMAASKMFAAGFLPQGGFLLMQVLLAPLLMAVVMLAVVALPRLSATGGEKVAIASLLLPLAAVLFYRNSFPYFYVFVLAPAAAGAAYAIEILRRRYGTGALLAVLVANAVVLDLREPKDILPRQQTLIEGARTIFGGPVTYFDFGAIIPSWPRGTRFMTSGYGLERYRAEGEAKLVRKMADTVVPLLIVDHRMLVATMTGQPDAEQFLPADAEALRGTYIHHWGPLWVPGRKVTAGAAPAPWMVRVPGDYTVEGASLVIDGALHPAGSLVRLSRGEHVIAANPRDPAVLRWGDNLPRPAAPAPEGAIFSEF